jgi:hypothetical protein
MANTSPCESLDERVGTVRLEDGQRQDGAVGRNQGEVDAELPEQDRAQLLDDPLDDLHERGDHDDEGDEPQVRRVERQPLGADPTPPTPDPVDDEPGRVTVRRRG